MTRADAIRAMSELPKRVIAKKLGVPTNLVTRYQWQDTHRELVRSRSRDYYHRNKTLGGVGENHNDKWTPEQEKQLKKLYHSHSFGAIAEVMGVSRNTVAGKVRRMRRDGKL